MTILKSHYLDQDIPEVSEEAYKEPFFFRQISSPFLTDVNIGDEVIEVPLKDDFQDMEDSYTYEVDEESEEEWTNNYKEEFDDESYEAETSYDFDENTYDESELEEHECTCSANEYETEFETSEETIIDDLDEAYHDGTTYENFKDEDELDENIDHELYAYENVDDDIYDAVKEEEFEEGYEEEIINEAEINRDIINEDLRVLEEAFAFGLDTLTTTWQKIKNSSIRSKSLPQKSSSGSRLKLPIVSTFLLDSKNYLKTKKSPDRYYGIPETISALEWIGKEWKKMHPNVDFIIRDISKLGGEKISGHKSHRMGIDADVKLKLSTDKAVIQAGTENYKQHRKYVRDLIMIVKKNPYLPIKVIGFQDTVLNKEFGSLVRPWAGHASHLHLRFCMPNHRKSELNLSKVYTADESKPNYNCKTKDKNTTATKPQGINIQNAIDYNKLNMDIVGWASYKRLIYIKLGLSVFSQDDSAFVNALATWQKENGLKGDGKLGSRTWAKMKSDFGNNIKASETILNSRTSVDFHNLGQGKSVPENMNNLRKFRLTTYYVEDQKDYPTGNIKIPIYDINKNIISFASPRFFAKLSLEGSAKLANGRLVNVTGKKVTVSHSEYSAVLDYHKKAYAKRNRARLSKGRKPISTGYSGIVTHNSQVKKALAFYVVPQSKIGLGFGTQRGIKMVPFRTLAADIGHVNYKNVDKKWKGKGGVIPPKTRVYIKEYDGLILPDKSIHDGWFIVNDTGGGIYGAHLDVFVGTKKLRKKMELPHIGHVWFEGIKKRVPAGYSYGLKP